MSEPTIPPLKGALVVLSKDVLQHLLGLPKDAVVSRVEAPLDEWGNLHLRVLNVGWPLVPGGMPVRTSSQLATRQDSDGATWFRAWCDLPPQEPPKEDEAPANG